MYCVIKICFKMHVKEENKCGKTQNTYLYGYIELNNINYIIYHAIITESHVS